METFPAPAKKSGLATTSLVLGILSLVPMMCCLAGALLGIPAVIIGHVSRGRIKASGGTLSGGGAALGGLVTGYLSIVLTVALSVPAWKFAMPYIEMAKSAAATEQVSTAATESNTWPADSNVTTGNDYIQVLIEKGALTEHDASLARTSNLQFGNVSSSDPGNTIFIRSKLGAFPNNAYFIIMKDGTPQIIIQNGEKLKGVPPPRTPQFLAD